MKAFFIIGFSGLLLAGCANHQAPTVSAIQPQTSIFSENPELENQITILSQDSHLDANGIFIARTIIRNETPSPITLRAQTLFKNMEGFTADSNPAQDIVLQPLEERAYVAKSIRPNIDKYIVYFSDTKNVEAIGVGDVPPQSIAANLEPPIE